MAHLVCGLKGTICTFSNLKIKIEGTFNNIFRTLPSLWRTFDRHQYIVVIQGKKIGDCLLCFCQISKGCLHVSFKTKYHQTSDSQGSGVCLFVRIFKLLVPVKTINFKVLKHFQRFMGINLNFSFTFYFSLLMTSCESMDLVLILTVFSINA